MQTTNHVNFRSQNELFFYHHSTTLFPAPQNAIVPHSHLHFEIMHLVEGDLDFIVEGKSYRLQSGDMLLIRPNEYHSIKSNASVYTRRVISFEEKYLQAFPDAANGLLRPYAAHKEDFDGYIPCHIVKSLRMDELFDKLEQTLTLPDGVNAYLPIRLFSLLMEINGYIFSASQTKNGSYIHSVIDGIIKYIDANVSQKITLDDLEKHVNLSKYYLSHLFKKTMGISVVNYIIEKKIRHAEQLIRQGVPPTKASLMVGYSNYPNFYENYKKITKTTPKDTTIVLRVPLG